jgi:hypothetical protein
VIKTAISVIRPVALNGDSDEYANSGEIAAPVAPEVSPKAEAKNPLSVSEATSP